VKLRAVAGRRVNVVIVELSFAVLQLHLAAMSSLKGEVIELSNRLQRVHAEKDVLDKQFAKLHV